MNRALLAVCLSIGLSTAACRMADGPVPDSRDPDIANQLGDIERDLENVLSGDPQARQDFQDDLMRFADLSVSPGAEAPIKQLAGQIVEAVIETKAKGPALTPLVERLFVAINARDLSEGQAKALGEDVLAALSRMGVDDVKARAIVAQVAIVQQAVTDRHRRWYEVF
jgi:hypothetical protein